MMRRLCIAVCVMASLGARGGEKMVHGKVTYIASGTVYTSLGREMGVQDSTLLVITSGNDTTATLKVFASSSKSSVCWVMKSSRPVNIGDDVSGKVMILEEKKRSVDTTKPTTLPVGESPLDPRTPSTVVAHDEFLNVQGRISAQYFTSLYDNKTFNIAQPGIVLNMRGVMRDVPLKLDVYANFRTLSIGGQSPFSQRAINQSRIYGLSLSYDDGENVLSVGRIIPVFSPSIGYIDGALASKKFGSFVIGTTLGYQPDFSLRSVSTDYKKLALFAQYATLDRLSFSVSMAYARTYFHSALDREAASVLVNASVTNDLYVYANTEVDLRKKSGTEFVLSPRLTSAYVNLNYRMTNSFSLGLGVDASRSYYSFEAVRHVPDSLLMNDLRSGLSVNLNWFLPGGISLYNTYTPRNSKEASFGKDYSNYSSLSIADVFSSGINLRSNFNFNANQYTNANGYGVSLQKTFEQFADLNLRFQRNGYTIKQTDQRNNSTTLGADLMVFITNALSFLATYDRLDGYGTVSNSVFAEISVRF